MDADSAGAITRIHAAPQRAVLAIAGAVKYAPAMAFDGVRTVFQKASERRARIKAQGIAEGVVIGREEGREEGRDEGRSAERQYLRRELERLGVALPPEAVNLFSEPGDSIR